MVDQKIIEECRDGNLQNFRELIRISTPYAFSVAFRILGDEDTTKDIVQETLITLWTRLKEIRTPATYKTWLYRIVVNKCYDHLRKSRKQVEKRADEMTWRLISEHISGENNSDLENRETAMIVNLLTDRLSPKQKVVFILSDLEEMDAEEISEITGMTRRNIKANLHYARKNISEMIMKYI